MRGAAAPGAVAGRGLVFAALLSLVAVPDFAAAQTEMIGVTAAIRNSVQIRRPGTPQPSRAALRQRVALNDEVQTGRDSQLQILLLDRSMFTVGSNARVRLDRFVYDARRNARSVGAAVMRGAFRFISGRPMGAPGTRAVVRTPVATLAIRGTILEGVVGADAMSIAAAEAGIGPTAGGDEETATLIVLRGPGPKAGEGTRPGAIDVYAGEAVFVLDAPSLALYLPGGGLPPVGPFQISPAGLLALQQLLAPPLAPAGATFAGEDAAPRSDGGGAGVATLGFFATISAILIALVVPTFDDSADQPLSP